jgi:hypothetical protein
MVKIASNLNAAPSGLILTRLAVLTDTVGGGIDFKKCTKCGEEKPLKDFFNDKKGRLGKNSRCKKCNSEQSRRWLKNHHVKVLEYGHHYRNKHHTQILERARLWDKSHRSQKAEYNHRWYKVNRVKSLERCRQWRKSHPAQELERHRRWREKNPLKLAERNHRLREELPDSIIKNRILQCTPLKRNQISPEHINLTRALIKLRRALNTKPKHDNIKRHQ